MTCEGRSQKSLGTTMIHIGECTRLPAQHELDQCSAVEVLSSSSRHKKHCADLSKYFSLQDPQRTLQICRSSSHFKIHNNTADLPKFFSLKIYIKHCRFVEVILSSRSTTNTVDLSKFFSLQDPQQTLHIGTILQNWCRNV
jgi:hypothetical protein